MKRLIVNADDFGMTSSINRAVIDLFRSGVLSSTTLMVNGEAAAEAARLFSENGGLGVGLHVNLTDGPPTLPPGEISSLTGSDGRFPGVNRMLLRLSLASARMAELEREIQAQVESCLELGISPTHVDSHHHIHAHPRVMIALTRVCRRAGIGRARGYRMSPRSLKALAIRTFSSLPVRGGGLVTPDRFAGIEEMGKRDIAGALSAELKADGDTLEYMCHPGYADERLCQVSTYNRLREVELNAMVSGDFKKAMEEAGVSLISFAGM